MSALVEEAQRQRREKPVEKITTKPATTKEPRSVLQCLIILTLVVNI